MLQATDYTKGTIILIDKPLHWSSFQVVNKVRWLLKKRFDLKKIKVGHAGTLDPLATGLLILCTGSMTKQIQDFQSQTKRYQGTFYLGATTPSYDLEHPINEHFPTKHIDKKLIEDTRTLFLGEILQVPPIFSALKKDGKKLYELARAGEQVALSKRNVTIHHFNILDHQMPNIHFEVHCSKGTYIRSLVHDFGKALGSGAHLTSLRRTQIGTFKVADAHSITSFESLLKKMLSN